MVLRPRLSRIAIVALLLVGVATPATAQPEASSDEARLLARAVTEYRAGLEATSDRGARRLHFETSTRLFAQAIADRVRDARATPAELWIDHGNAAFQAGDLGAAILSYRRAIARDPDAPRARQNLTQARRNLPEWIPVPDASTGLSSFFFWEESLSRSERALTGAVLFLVASLLLAFAIRTRRGSLRSASIVGFVAWLVVLVPLMLEEREDSDAVVIASEVSARAADAAGAPLRFSEPLPGGTELEVLETRGDWSRIRLYDGREAWVDARSIERVHVELGRGG